MALLGASFQIGRSALSAYQAAISVVGQNIANVGNPDYTRQTGRLSALYGGVLEGGITPGNGVRMTELERHFDAAIEARLRSAAGIRTGAEATYQTMSQVEALYNELTDQDISTQLEAFFGSFSTLQNTPEESTTRNLVLSSADDLIRSIKRIRSGLLQHAIEANDAITAAVQRANALTAEIASLNEKVVTEEATGQRIASALRDRRDGMVRELSTLMDIRIREQENGAVNIYVGSEPVVEAGYSHGLTTEATYENGYDTVKVRFADNNGTVLVHGGRIGGLLVARDEHLEDQLQRLDQFARGLIYEVNRVHADGRGLIGNTDLTGEYTVDDVDAALDAAAAGLRFPITNGTFIVNVRESATGQTVTRQINVDLDGIGADMSLTDLAAALSNVPGLSAAVTSDSRLRLTSADGNEFWFSEDTSGALAALGLGAFFSGVDAETIAIRSDVRSDNRLLAASISGETGDGNNAGLLAALGKKSSALLSGLGLSDFHGKTINDLAVATAAAQTEFDAADSVYASLTAQREAISGVSLDEEAINLSRFETAYQGAARYLSVLDQLSSEVLALVG